MPCSRKDLEAPRFYLRALNWTVGRGSTDSPASPGALLCPLPPARGPSPWAVHISSPGVARTGSLSTRCPMLYQLSHVADIGTLRFFFASYGAGYLLLGIGMIWGRWQRPHSGPEEVIRAGRIMFGYSGTLNVRLESCRSPEFPNRAVDRQDLFNKLGQVLHQT